jgi:hypothetical protein
MTTSELPPLPRNPRAFIDKNGGYQSARTGVEKEAHDAWVRSNTWNLTRDDFIRLSYFHGCMEDGSDGSGPVNGSNDRPHDVVYMNETGGCLTRSMVSSWLSDFSSFMRGYLTALAPLEAEVERLRMDAARLDYLQARGATVDLAPDGYDGEYLAMAFRIGGLHRTVSRDIRAAIDSAMNTKVVDKQPAAPKRGKPGEAAARRFLADYIATRQEWIDKGMCPDCHGEGTVGGQFSGGYQTCETCGGSGKPAALTNTKGESA